MSWWPCNDCCGKPCECETAFDAYVVDFGIGGLTNEECDQCEEIAGEFTVTLDSCTGLPNSLGIWIFDLDVCDACQTWQDDTNPNGCPDTIRLRIRLSFSPKVPDTDDDCLWRVRVFNFGAVGPQCDLDACSSFVQYEGPTGQINPRTLPVTLTKVGEDWTAVSGSPECSGSLPVTITLEAV